MRLFHVSTGLGTILLGVSGNCDDSEVTSLPEEFPREPDSEKDTWDKNSRHNGFQISGVLSIRNRRGPGALIKQKTRLVPIPEKKKRGR